VFSAPLCRSYFQRSKCFDFSCFLAESVSDCVGPLTERKNSNKKRKEYLFKILLVVE
jgi:hypothetical protein